jgi:TIR domain
MAKVFISYRWADSATLTGRIYDRLIAKFGRKNVFKDVDDIPPGVNFAQYIPDSLRQCAVELVVIGPQWLETRDTQGNRRLDDPADFVRLEIETALNLGLVVIPLLVDDATMPASADLPESINQLSLINALQVRNDPDFARDMERVITGVERGFARKDVTSAPERRTRRTALPTIKLPVRLRRPLIIVLTLLLISASFTALVETGGGSSAVSQPEANRDTTCDGDATV